MSIDTITETIDPGLPSGAGGTSVPGVYYCTFDGPKSSMRANMSIIASNGNSLMVLEAR